MMRAAILALACLLPALAQAADIAGTASVIDGDTLDIHGTRIRLHGIDAPAPRTPTPVAPPWLRYGL